MVDFNSEVTVGLPAWKLLPILVLQRRDAVIDAFEAYDRQRGKGLTAGLYEVQTRLRAFFKEIQPHLKASLKEEAYIKLKKEINTSKDGAVLETCFETLNEWLYNKELIKWDTRKRYDSSLIENENYETGLG